MTLDAALAAHDHISERESDGSWEDCTWDAGLEFYRLAFDASRPASHAEAQALRKASGEPTTGGSNIGDFIRGVQNRYGRALGPAVGSFASLWALLSPGTVALVQGSMAAFGPTHRLSRWQRGFDDGHAVMVARLPDGTIWWCDPLGTDTGYVGEAITKSELKAFVEAFGGQHIVAPIKTKEPPVANLTSYLPGYTAIVKTGSNIRREPRIASGLLHQAAEGMAVKVVGTVTGDVDPANGSTVWYEIFHDGRSEYTAKDNITALTPPVASTVEDGFTKATQQAAVDLAIAAGKAAMDAHLKSDTAALTAAKAAGVAQEKARVKNLLGL